MSSTTVCSKNRVSRLSNVLESLSSENTKAKRYDNYLPVRELNLKDPRPKNYNQPIAMGLEGIQAVVSYPSTVATGPCDASGEKNKGRSAVTHEVCAHAVAYDTDSYGFHQMPENVVQTETIFKSIQDAEDKMYIPGLMETAHAVAPANTAMAQLDTFSATYLQPLSAFNAVVTGIANVCLPN